MKIAFLLIISSFILNACGVKGKPLPLNEPPSIGLGIEKETENESSEGDPEEVNSKSKKTKN